MAAAQAGAFSEIASMDSGSFDREMNVAIWCQQGMTKDVANSIAAAGGGQPQGGNGCAGAVLPILEPDANPKENPRLKELRTVQDVVVMVDYPAFGITAVSWIPAGYQVKP
jgi:hypothetical protein